MPSDKHIVESHKRETSQAKDYSKKGQVNRLTLLALVIKTNFVWET